MSTGTPTDVTDRFTLPSYVILLSRMIPCLLRYEMAPKRRGCHGIISSGKNGPSALAEDVHADSVDGRHHAVLSMEVGLEIPDLY